MFSTSQQQYIQTLLPTYAKEGYKYYVIYSNTMVNSSYYASADPDLYAVFSKKAISAQDAYTFNFEDTAILVTVRSGNYSSNSSSINTDRVRVEEFNEKTLHINVYEHVYTNAEFSDYVLQPDYNLISGGETNVRLEAISFILLVALFISFIGRIFRKR